MDAARLTALHRFPVKGLSPEPLDHAVLEKGQYFPGDRLFAVENGPSNFDPAAPAFQPKTRFLVLMVEPYLACLRTRYDDATGTLTIAHQAGVVSGDLGTATGRTAIEAFLARYCADDLKGPPKIVTAPAGGDTPFRFTDSRRSGFVSILNTASIDALAQSLGAPVDPLRFRGNLLVDGWPAWSENALPGRTLAVGTARLEVLTPIVRCLATHADPQTGVRDLDIMGTLKRETGDLFCGIYARIKGAGRVAVGDAITLAD